MGVLQWSSLIKIHHCSSFRLIVAIGSENERDGMNSGTDSSYPDSISRIGWSQEKKGQASRAVRNATRSGSESGLRYLARRLRRLRKTQRSVG